MHARPQRSHAVLMMLLATFAALLAGTPASAATGPQLRIAVDDGHTSVSVGDTLDYTVTVDNRGSADVVGLGVTLTVPAGVTFRSADPGSSVRSGRIGWQHDVKAMGKATFHARMTVVARPKGLVRLATVSCAGLPGDKPPIVCASHSDHLAAAVDDRATGVQPATGTTVWLACGGIAVAGLLIVVAALVRRHRRARRIG